MIKSLRLNNFKNFADETLHLGPFTLIVGANASGKSNIRDAFRFLHGVSRYYTLAEILGGKYGAEWQPIRGAPNEIIRFGQDAFALEVVMTPSRSLVSHLKSVDYRIRIQRDSDVQGRLRVAAESVSIDPASRSSPVSGTMYTTDLSHDRRKVAWEEDSKLHLLLPEADELVEVGSDQPGLTQIARAISEILEAGEDKINESELPNGSVAKVKASFGALQVVMALTTMRFLELSPMRMREPSLPGSMALGDSGDDLPTVLKEICNDPQRKQILLSWLHELTPMDVVDLKFPPDPSGRIHLHILDRNGREVSAYSTSDGTLRFLGLLAALLNEHFEGLYFFEEIDNGIHPARLHLLLDLIERQTAKGKIQVVATTHSPDVLNLINDTTFENAVVVYRDEDSADAVIRRVAELPNARELRKSQGLGRLHTGGWMENILSFAEADKEDRKDGA